MRDERHKVVGLIRVSTKEQADDDRAGIARQREVIAHTVLVKRLDLVSTIQLDDVSGTNVRHCSEIVELLSLVEKKNIQGVVLADLDRLLRPDRFEDFSLLQVFQDSGAILYCGDQEINLASDSGYLLAGVQALLSGNELRTIKRRINGAKEEKRKQGKCPNAAITIPTGVTYDRKAEKWGYTSEVVKVQEAFRLIDEENITNYRDLERKTGIHHRTLHNILRNPIYIGIRCIDKKRGTQKYASENGRQSDRKKVKRLPHEIIKVPVMEQPAVDPARFNRVQAILGNKKTSWSSSRSAPSQRLLTGVGHCAACGELLYCSSSAGKTRRQPGYYICRRNYYLYRPQTGGCPMKNIRQDKTDEAVIRWVAEKLTDRQVLDGILANYIGTQKSSNTESAQCVADVQEALDAIEQKRQRLNHGWLDNRFNDEQHDTLRNELDAEERRLKVIMARQPNSTARTDIEKRLSFLVKGALAFSRIRDRLTQKTVIQQLFAEIHIGGDGIKGFKLRPQFDADVCKDGSRTGRGSWPQST